MATVYHNPHHPEWEKVLTSTPSFLQNYLACLGSLWSLLDFRGCYDPGLLTAGEVVDEVRMDYVAQRPVDLAEYYCGRALVGSAFQAGQVARFVGNCFGCLGRYLEASAPDSEDYGHAENLCLAALVWKVPLEAGRIPARQTSFLSSFETVRTFPKFR